MITIYLGDTGCYLRQQTCSIDNHAKLITQDNLHDLQSGTYYTSIGDLGSLENLGTVLQQANKIVYAPPAHWSDEARGVSQMRHWTEDYLNVFSCRCEVENYWPKKEFNQILHLADQRKTSASQLWIAGCSISHGSGVCSNTRYGQLLANRLNLQTSFLTQPGSSISWAADQILRSDIRPNDVVVWGLTHRARLSKFDQDNWSYITINWPKLDTFTAEYLASDHVVYQAITSVFQVVHFCQKVRATLVVASLLDHGLISYLQNLPGHVMLGGLWGRDSENLFADIGSDGQHPGSKTHAFYAEQIYQKIQELIAHT